MRSGALRPCCVAPGTTPHTICLSVSLFYVLNSERDVLAAADAHGDEAVAATSAGKLVDGFGHQDRARGADGMTERDSAAVRIGALRGKAKLARHRTGLRRERLIGFDHVEIRYLQPGPGKQLAHGIDRPDAHHVRLHPGVTV